MSGKAAAAATPTPGAGAWTEDEHALFVESIVVHGWGNWKSVQASIPTRDRAQVKSHAQKFQKRYAAEVDRLRREHEKIAEKADVVVKVKAKAKEKAVDKFKAKIEAKKAGKKHGAGKSTPRRRKSVAGKVKAPALRPRRRLSAPGSIGGISDTTCATPVSKRRGTDRLKGKAKATSSPVAKKWTSPRKKAVSDAEKKASEAEDVMEEVAASVGRVSLAGGAPTISAKTFDLMSPSPMTPARSFAPIKHGEDDPRVDEEDDDLAALAARVTPSPAFGHRTLLRQSTVDDVMQGTEDLALPMPLSKDEEVEDKGKDEESIEPLLNLEVDDANLDSIAEFLDPSWNVMGEVGVINQGREGGDGKDSAPVQPIPAVSGWAARGAAATSPTYSQSSNSNVQSFSFEVPNVRPDPSIFAEVRDRLTSAPDFNDPREYVSGDDGLSRRGLEAAPLCRSRVRTMLEEHLNAAWWRDDLQVAGDAFKKMALERLVALTAVMLDVQHWRASDAEDASARFNDEDDVRHIGQMLSGCWDRVNRSLHRTGFDLLGDDVSARMERHAAVVAAVGRIDSLSRQEDVLMLDGRYERVNG